MKTQLPHTLLKWKLPNQNAFLKGVEQNVIFVKKKNAYFKFSPLLLKWTYTGLF